jgi:hypothetical protein
VGSIRTFASATERPARPYRAGRGGPPQAAISPQSAEAVCARGGASADWSESWHAVTRCPAHVRRPLAGIAPVDGYEVPDSMREAMALRTPADAFPHANSVSRRLELDHTVPYLDPDHGGPPGQTRPGNLGPMTRRHHRIKTHSAWAVRQIGDGAYLWRSPHGRHYLVDQTGTTAVTPIPAA